MALKRLIVELGMGTDLRGSDYTKAAVRALKDALWHNSLTIAPALGRKPEDMHVKVLVGVPGPISWTGPPWRRCCRMGRARWRSSKEDSRS